MFKISKDIPAPSRRRFHLYPFQTLEVGESFFVPNGYIQLAGSANTRYAPKRFTARTRTEEGVKGIRVWRIDDLT
jgi:hypothetical protein